MIAALAVAAGGALGTLARYGVNVLGTKVLGQTFYGTIGMNILGSLTMGILIGAFAMKDPVDPTMKLFLTTGILGGFTTFSAFSLETLMLYDRKPVLAFAYVAASVVLSIAACWIGLRLMRGVSA